MAVRLIIAALLFVLLPVSEANAQDDVDCQYRDKDREAT